MARTRAQAAAKRQSPAPKDQGKRPQGIKRRSAPRGIRRPQQQLERAEPNQTHSSPEALPQQDLSAPLQRSSRKRKRPVEDTLDPSTEPTQKQPRTSPPHPTENTSGEPATGTDAAERATDPVAFWVTEERWPKEQNWPEESSETVPTMERVLARRRSSRSLKRANSATSTTPSDQKPREEKSAPYRDPRYKTLLATKGSFMDESALGITEESKKTYHTLLESKQTMPNDSLFHDDFFKATCRGVEDRNEARVIRDITSLLVPSAEIFAIRGATKLKCLIESTNEGWNNSLPLTGTRPQPDYSVGFRREAFTEDHLTKLSPYIGDFVAGDQSFFMATYYMYFPFLACEVKCGAQALDIADRQNAHSMTLAARGIVELFRLVKREDELNRQILAFSISHDHRSVRIYGHYPVIDGKDTKYYRHPIHTFDFTALDGKEKWTAYRFTKNVYDLWMPEHFKRICSAIDQVPPELDFDVPSLPETGLSQGLESHHLSNADSASVAAGQNIQSSASQGVTPDTSFTEPGAKKRKEKKQYF